MDMTMYDDLYFDYDLKENPVGDFVLTADKKQSILIRLKTPYGTNVFNPMYGNKIYDILSDNINENWVYTALNYEKECVEQDTTIKVADIDVDINQPDRRVIFTIKYKDTESMEIDSIKWGESIG